MCKGWQSLWQQQYEVNYHCVNIAKRLWFKLSGVTASQKTAMRKPQGIGPCWIVSKTKDQMVQAQLRLEQLWTSCPRQLVPPSPDSFSRGTFSSKNLTPLNPATAGDSSQLFLAAEPLCPPQRLTSTSTSDLLTRLSQAIDLSLLPPDILHSSPVDLLNSDLDSLIPPVVKSCSAKKNRK